MGSEKKAVSYSHKTHKPLHIAVSVSTSTGTANSQAMAGGAMVDGPTCQKKSIGGPSPGINFPYLGLKKFPRLASSQKTEAKKKKIFSSPV